MTQLSVSANFELGSSVQLPPSGRQHLNTDAFLRRMERLNSRRPVAQLVAQLAAPRSVDAELLREHEALDRAWGYEVRTLIATKRLKTPEAAAMSKAARAATEEVARRIETTKAHTPDGLKVKARAALWRRHGEPLEADKPVDETVDFEPIADAMLQRCLAQLHRQPATTLAM